MIKIGVSIDDNPVKEYLNLLSGEYPFLISGFSHSVNSKMYSPNRIKNNNSFISLLENSNALLFLEGATPDPEKISYALKKFKHVFLTRLPDVSEDKLMEFQKLANEANVFLKAANPLLYNPAYVSCKTDLQQTKFIEVKKKAEPKLRSSKEMVRSLTCDLEFIFMILKSNPKKIFSSGSFSHSDIPVYLNTRIEFDNGTSANINYDFLQPKDDHSATIFMAENNYSLDFTNLKIQRNQLKNRAAPSSQITNQPVSLISKPVNPDTQNPYHMELQAFYESIAGISDPVIIFEDSLMAQTVARSILNKIHIPKPSPA